MTPENTDRVFGVENPEDNAELPDYEKIQRGDKAAWSEGYKILWGVAYAVCHGVLRNCPAVDKDLVILDAVEEVIAVAAKIPSWTELKKFTARVARCRAIDAIRKSNAQRHGGGQLDSLEDTLVELVDFKSPTPDESLYLKEIRDSYQQCAQELPEKSRQLMELRLLEQLTQKKISEKLKIPQGTIGVMIMKILQMVRRCFEARGFTL